MTKAAKVTYKRPLDVFVPPDDAWLEPLRAMLGEVIEANITRPQAEYEVVFTQATLVNSGELLLRSMVIAPEVAAQITAIMLEYREDATQ